MAVDFDRDVLWNTYITKHEEELTDFQQLPDFSKNKSNSVTALSFSNAQETFVRIKGKGIININHEIDMIKLTGEEIEILLNENDHNGVHVFVEKLAKVSHILFDMLVINEQVKDDTNNGVAKPSCMCIMCSLHHR